ncbi:PQQ-binding-like beta-propeller repeat protein [Micromonospora eburnea]|uniref:Uncharacterized protein n=1 Tax=Micromonospora eburnea TaxID=227316 RepID=A0A1C6UY53_9ACTN|nr:PQQ-binding-like beta-propeller repeat protein [Micromonospora eburnea]SCL59015.1 hypothetical protein GA0070604_3961 [Micromonospora eburnea]
MGGLRFLPWVRDGVARLISDPVPQAGAAPALVGTAPPAGGPAGTGGRRPARAGVTLSVSVEGSYSDGSAEPVRIDGDTTAYLYGPGDVTALDARQVIRSYPAAGAENVDVTAFAAVEFDRPDLPWLHTPARPDPLGRLEPWLVLVVVPVGPTGRLEKPIGGALPRLATTVEELPDLTESWAWAHAQVLLATAEEDVASTLVDHPERTLSRLICPRRLAPGTEYLAAVVPAFDAGVRAGLGLPADAAEVGPAWGGPETAPQDPVLLPVYHHWTFRTGPDGDFESLVRRLRARALPADVGRRQVDVSAAGGGLPEITPAGVPGRSVLAFEGALASPSMTPDAWAPEVAEPWQARMAELLEHVEDWFTPPLYGEIHLQEGRVPPPGGEPVWLAGLNLDPRYRAAAGLGTQVVQKYQEELATAAWERAAQLREVNEQLRRGRAARDTATALYAKRVDPGTPGGALGNDQLVTLTRPVHDLVAAPPPSLAAGPVAATAESLDDLLVGNEGARAATSAPYRRLVRPRGPLARRARPEAGRSTLAAAGRESALSRLARGATAVPPARIPTGGTLIDDVLGEGIETVTPELVRQAAADPWWRGGGRTGMAAARAALAGGTDTTIASNGGDPLGEDRYFVATHDGRLFEHRRLDGTWVWRDHGTPPGTTVTTSGAVAPPDRIYVGTRARRLFERRWDGDRWIWTDCGGPPGGTASRPTASGRNVFQLGADGQLHHFDPVARTWTPLGRPDLAPGERLWGSPRPVPGGVYVATSTGRLFGYHGTWSIRVSSPVVWGSPASLHQDPYGDERLAYLTPDGQLGTVRLSDGNLRAHGRVRFTGPPLREMRIVSLAQRTTTSGIGEEPEILVLAHPDGQPSELQVYGRTSVPDDRQSGLINWLWTEGIGRPDSGIAPHRPGPVLGNERDGELFVRTAAGGMAAYQWGDRGHGWLDFGPPADPRGAGPVDAPAPAPPPAENPYPPRVGLLSSLLVAYQVDDGTDSVVRTQSVHHLDEHGALRENVLTPAAAGPRTGTPAQGVAVTLGTPAATVPPRLFAVAVLPGPDANSRRLAYWVGTGLTPDGAATAWTGPYALPDPISRYAGPVAATVVDLDGDKVAELVVAYAVNDPAGTSRVYYRVGWGLDPSGRVTRGWSDSLPAPYAFQTVRSVGVQVVDMTGDLTPDLFLFATGRDIAGQPLARYGTGRGINRRGRVADGAWTVLRAVDNEATVAAAPAAGAAVADLTGTRQPDVVVSYRAAAGTLATQVGFDLDATGVPVRWSPPQLTPGLADPGTGRGCTLFLGDLRPDLVADRATMGDQFILAADAHQGWLVPVQALARDEEPERIPLDAAAYAARSLIRPETAVPDEVLAEVSVDGRSLVDVLPDSGDPLRPLLAGITFDVPAYELLRGLSQEHIAPNLPAVAPETMTALAANPRFIEAFLVGLNHEMSREMLWRGFPADPRQTWFRQFWDVRGARSAGDPLTDIPPLTDDAWRNGPLGTHLTAVGAPGEQSLVLVIRGEVLRRFPSTVVTMRRAAWVGTRREPVGVDLPPIFNAWLSPDLLLFGFPFTADEARGEPDPGGDPGYFFLLREQPTAARFGLDLAPEEWPPPVPPDPLERWDDLHWGHLPDGAVFLSPAAPGLPTDAIDGAVFGRTAADMARVVLQKPVLLARHASDLLPTPENPS